MSARKLVGRSAAIGASALFLLAGPAPSVHGAGVRTATTPTTTSTSAADPVNLLGEGSYDVTGELTAWQNAILGPNGAISMNYLPQGGAKGRDDLVSSIADGDKTTGDVDFAISGVPFTADELGKIKGGASGIIAAPVLATGLGVLVLPPKLAYGGTGWGEESLDPDGDISGFQAYKGPVNVPTENLAAMLLSVPGFGGEWDDPAIRTAFGLPADTTNQDGSSTTFEPEGRDIFPSSYLQSEGSEQNYYVQQLAQTGAPDLWAKVTGGSSSVVPGDTLPASLNTIHTTQGLDNALAQVEPKTLPALPTYGGDGGGGYLTAVPASGLEQLRAQVAAQSATAKTTLTSPAEWVAAENDKGQYLTPSPQSIDAAVNAGNDTPLYGLTHSVDGAYPYTYVDDMYVPAKGLSVDKTEAIATIIRYLATDGQSLTSAANDGQLSSTLVDNALNAANQVVSSNCTAAGGTVVKSSDPGRFDPGTPDLKKIGSMLHCDGASAAAKATGDSVSGVSGGTFADAGVFTPTDGSLAAGTNASAPGSAVAASATSSAKGKAGGARSGRTSGDSGAITLANLPGDLPWSGTPAYDRLGALLLGAGFFLVGRRGVRWLVKLCQG